MKKKELCVKLVIYKDNTEMHGQQNIKSHFKSQKMLHMCMFYWPFNIHLHYLHKISIAILSADFDREMTDCYKVF
jgi:hypothetical protein